MSTPVVVELFTTPNRITKTGKPERWRWRLLIDDGEPETRSKGSFPDEPAALKNAYREVRGFADVMLRSPGQDDVRFR